MAIRRLRRSIAAGAVVALGLAAFSVSVPSSASPHLTRHSYPGAVPAVATRVANASSVAANATVEGEMYLYLRHAGEARTLAGAVSAPGNSAYGKFVSPSQWINRFSPTVADFTAVETYLRDSGFTIYATPTSRLFVIFRGPASVFNAAFATTMREYPYQGRELTAPSSAPSLPVSIATTVSGLSLGDSSARTSAAVSAPTSAVRSNSHTAAAATQKCSEYWDQHQTTMPKAYGETTFPTSICGYLPAQLRSSAHVTSSENGAGQTIAIVDAYASPTIVSDTNSYMKAVGSPPLTHFSQVKPAHFIDEAACGYPSGWQAEEAIDVQSSHSVAPAASLVYVGGFNCIGGLDIAVSDILDHHLATFISNSYYYAAPEEFVSTDQINGEENDHLQAAAEGIGMYFCTGDDGDLAAVSGGVAGPSYEATSPWVTGVGGTSLAIGSAGQYLFETGWGSDLDQPANGSYAYPLPGFFYAGAGGGTSELFAQPAYQAGIVPESLATGPNGTLMRVEPDVSDLADPFTGFLISISPITNDGTLKTGPRQYETYGGTSLATPMVAAKMALLQQALGRTIGFANPLLYQARRASASTFHDVLPPASPLAVSYQGSSGNRYLVTLNQDTSLTTTKGFDDVTGLGSLRIPELIKALRGR